MQKRKEIQQQQKNTHKTTTKHTTDTIANMQQVVDGKKTEASRHHSKSISFHSLDLPAILRAAQKHCIYFVLAPDTV